jgi:hypothetical protein
MAIVRHMIPGANLEAGASEKTSKSPHNKSLQLRFSF